MASEIGEICSFQDCVGRECTGFRKVEAEGQLALEPWLHRMAVSGEHLRRCRSRESREVLIQNFGGKSIVSAANVPGCEADSHQQKRSSERRPEDVGPWELQDALWLRPGVCPRFRDGVLLKL